MQVSFGSILHFVNKNPQKDFTYKQATKITEYLKANYPQEKPLKLITIEEDQFNVKHERVLALTGKDKSNYLRQVIQNGYNVFEVNKLVEKAKTIVVS
ncbi:MAG: hypothetical protein PHX18_02660 [Candidatus Gastranaerophilales bacterium]|nr:hypothetical protein [Candidatus Gastranaerophilales bacterium]